MKASLFTSDRRVCSCVLLLSLILVPELPGVAGSGHTGYVRFHTLGMPGAVVIATREGARFQTITDSEGAYSFEAITEGSWRFDVEMSGFAPLRRELVIETGAEPTVWELRMLSITDLSEELSATASVPSSLSVPDMVAAEPKVGTAAEALLIHGSVNEGASPAFGNNRKRGQSLYTADLSLSTNNSALDARSFSMTGQDTPRSAYDRSEASVTLDGPLLIPFLFRTAPRLSVIYGRTQNRNATSQAARVPTPAERSGDFSTNTTAVVDPASGLPFPGNVIPAQRISPQAASLLGLYPLPNALSARAYNYQASIVGVTHRDNFQLQTGGLVAGQQFSGGFGLVNTRTDNPNLFGFTDRLGNRAVTGSLGWSRRFARDFSITANYTFRRTLTRSLPHFAYRENISGDAGITGNAEDPANWGPPNLNFSGGIASLSDGQHSFDRTQSSATSSSSSWNRGPHTLGWGFSLARQQFNLLSDGDARGSFTFTGVSSGVDFADFLLGLPAASSISFGQPDRYFRQSDYDTYVMDDWRIGASWTLNAGLRWEYESPIVERYGRLVNLDIAPEFQAVAPVFGNDSKGPLTGQVYPRSLVRPDRGGFQPRIGLAWRAREDSSVVVRAGYGIYRETAVYRSIAADMSQQFPFSMRLSRDSSASSPLTLANGFTASLVNPPPTFAVDPDFRVGYAQNWQLSVQQDLPAALQVTATYLGVKGTHLQQRELPNTSPSEAQPSCETCPAGYVYLTSNGNSIQHAGTFQIRRLQRNGFAASLEYTWSKAIDDSGLGALHIAQDWRNPGAERALSNFDQRHRMTVQVLYTPGPTASLGNLQGGWLGTLVRDWTIMTELRLNSGSPLTPTMLTPVKGTAVTGTLRPDRTDAPLYSWDSNAIINRSAFSLPAADKWGNAGRNSITGRGQYFMDLSIGRLFRLGEGMDADLRVDVTNVLNHTTFAGWNTVLGSSQFGLPTAANSMRTIRPSLRLRF